MIECSALRMALSPWDKGSYVAMYFALLMGLAFTQAAGFTVARHGETKENMTDMQVNLKDSLGHLYMESASVQDENAGGKLSRHKRDLAWSDIEKFYADKNNFAMYLVLPLIVLVYGGCAVIYCIARLRRFLKNKKKKKRDQEDFSEDAMNSQKNDAVPPNDQQSVISTISNNNNNNQPNSVQREGAKTSSDVNISLDHSETPLPWQVPDEKEPLFAKGAMTSATEMNEAVMKERTKKQQQPLPQNGYTNKGFDEDSMHSRSSPPPYEARPVSKPPPYRRESVDEIIMLDESEPQNQDRKRKRPSSRSEKVSTPLDARERARRLVRGDTSKYLPPSSTTGLQNRKSATPSFNLQTGALSPKYQPPKDDTSFDSVAMAKQAAQLLRLDHNGNQGGGKKTKRLVFVAE
ncbi:hypothetical protein CHS0354_007960 [Potamilus streckersoni]|uniref:Uncharacterized protein n=1 Tax=Potamilus streckersoni TaxID=2493646 RepID=A0AAE0S346_9BIVA|nr:hypothetical protein CHS0354_007960 [Potamilus streckersoni]